MKKLFLFIFLLIPFFVQAEEEIVSTGVKYYKTISILNENTEEIISTTYEITEEEYNAAEDEPDRNNIIIETTYKKLTVTITQVTGAYKYKAKLHWKKIPKTRSYDIMSIGFYASVTPTIDPEFKQEYCNVDGNCYESTTHYLKTSSTGLGAMFHLPSGNLSSLDQTFQVVVMKKNPNVTIIRQRATADYAHATKTISYNNAKKFDVDIGGISLDSTILTYYDGISIAEATWNGTW